MQIAVKGFGRYFIESLTLFLERFWRSLNHRAATRHLFDLQIKFATFGLVISQMPQSVDLPSGKPPCGSLEAISRLWTPCGRVTIGSRGWSQRRFVVKTIVRDSPGVEAASRRRITSRRRISSSSRGRLG